MANTALAQIISERNAANDNAPRMFGAKPLRVEEAAVRSYLRLVRSGKASLADNESLTASFCGAAGLVVIRGKHAEVTEAGLRAS